MKNKPSYFAGCRDYLWSLFCLFAIGITFNPAAYSQERKTDQMQLMTDIQLLDKLALQNKNFGDQAVDEIFRRGDRMIPLLIQMKGDQRFFYGSLARNSNSASVIFSPTLNSQTNRRLLKEGKLVTAEVAALFLITAIYYHDLHISQSPYLYDFSLPSEKSTAANTKEIIKKAWIAAETWYERVKSIGIETARKNEDYPFRNGDVKFY